MNYEKILCPRVIAMPPSGIRKYFDILSEMKDAISLSIGEPDFDTPWHISDAAMAYVRDGGTHYTPNRGAVALRKQISLYMNARFGLD